MPSLQDLPWVYAYRDNGPMLGQITRWKPRAVYCTQQRDRADLPGIEYVVKFRQGAVGTAALISEVVCGGLFSVAGIAVPEPALVWVSGALSAGYTKDSSVPYAVQSGLHFGTKRLQSVEFGPPESVGRLAWPQELVDIWVLDSWVMNTDRETHGNILMRLDTRARWRLIAVDQSDGFGGAGRLSDGSVPYDTFGRAPSWPCLPAAVFDAGGSRAVRKSIDDVRRAAGHLGRAVARVPEAWWGEAGAEPDSICEGLTRRAQRMEDTVRVRQWEEATDAGKGGRVLDL